MAKSVDRKNVVEILQLITYQLETQANGLQETKVVGFLLRPTWQETIVVDFVTDPGLLKYFPVPKCHLGSWKALGYVAFL